MIARSHIKTGSPTRHDEYSPEERNASNLYNEKTFYRAFTKDLLETEREVIIYSPFASKFRTDFYKPIVEKLRHRNIEVFVFTRPVEDYEPIFQDQIRIALERYEEIGVCVNFMSRYIHEKAAIIDRKILWEGSLNILSQRASHEMMRRTDSEESAFEVLTYLKLERKLEEGYRSRYEKMCRNLKMSTLENRKAKLKIFALGIVTPVIVIWLFVGLSGMVLSLQGIISVFKIIRLFL